MPDHRDTVSVFYSFDDFEDFAERGEQLKRTAPKTNAPPSDARKFQHPQRHEALTRHAAFLRKSGLSDEAVYAALSVFNDERCDPPKPDDEVRSLARWTKRVDTGDHNAQEHEPGEPEPAEEQHDMMCRVMTEAVKTSKRYESIDVTNSLGILAPRYPSSIEGLETYGNTVVLADAGIGKSMMAISIALETASFRDWSVVYLNSELDEGEMATRIGRYCTGWGAAGSTAARDVSWIDVADGLCGGDILDICRAAVEPDRKLLVVMDSINTISEYAATDHPGADLAELRKLYNWTSQVRRGTGGAVSFLIISEENAAGGVKGRKGFYSADVVVRLMRQEYADDVGIIVQKSRSAPSGSLGIFKRDWKTGRFGK